MEDDSGQFLLLTAVVVAVGLVILLVFINQSSMSGYSSSESIMNFPKDNIRDFRAEAIDQAQNIASIQNSIGIENGSQRQDNFNTSYGSSIGDIKQLYAQKGAVVDVQFDTAYNGTTTIYADQKLVNANLIIKYDDGETSYNETYVADFG
jgi:hypothetical protein